MPAVPEQEQAPQQQQEATTRSAAGPQVADASAKAQRDLDPQQAAQQENAMQPFEWIGNDASSMDGPVTYARAMRGEIPMRPGNPNQKLETAKTAEEKGGKDMMDSDGLKLRIELNIDLEIELNARLRGDVTIALL